MRSYAYIFFALAALGAAVVLSGYMTKSPAMPAAASAANTTTLRIGTTTIVAEVADTPALREKGLGGRTELQDGAGMWFIFDGDGLWPFWMKDTLIALDMLWVDKEGVIVYIAHNVQPDSYPQSFAPAVPARYVLEVPGGYAAKQGIAEGDKVVVE